MSLKFKNLSCFALLILIAVKSIAADDAVTVGEVSKISLDELGILNEKQDGFSADLWKGGNRHFIESLLVKMPISTTSEVAKSLRKRLLLSSAVAPQITSDSSLSLIDLRLKLIAQTLDAANIGKFLGIIPPDRITEQMRQIHVSSLFMSDDYLTACAKAAPMLVEYKSIFWREAIIICKAFEKKKADVELSTNLLKEDATEIAPEFLTATSGLISGKGGKKEWNSLLQKTILKLPIVENPLPSMAKEQTVLSGEKLAEKLKKIEKLDKAENLAETAKVYATLESLGTPVTKSEWQDFTAYAISNDIQPPTIAISKLLGGEPLSKGETILIIIHSLNNGAKKIPADLLVQMVESLNNIGLTEDAKKLAEEGLF
jgi:hypothetical protein